jgi:hypothetical protein
MTAMKRFAVLALSTLVLSACGTSGGSVACTDIYWDGTIGTCLPEGWQIVPREKLTEKGLPAEVVAAFQHAETVSGQTPVLLVTREALSEEMSPTDYSDASVRSVSVLPAYKLVDSRDEDFDGEEVQIHIYNAQPASEEPARRFYQLSSSKEKNGYTFTALTPVSIPNSLNEEILAMLGAATLNEPTEE